MPRRWRRRRDERRARDLIDFGAVPKLLLTSAALVFVTWSLLRINPKFNWGSLYLDRRALSVRVVAAGAIAGAGLIGVTCLALLLTRQIALVSEPSGNWTTVALMGGVYFLVAASIEELTSRGYLFALIRRRWGWKSAVACTSLLFAAAHMFNPGATVESIVAVLLAGVFLGALLLALRSLYAVIAAHAAWNWTMSSVFHISVSGLGIPSPNYAVVSRGPAWLTGGHWGPEGGAAAIAAMLVATFFIYRKFLRGME